MRRLAAGPPAAARAKAVKAAKVVPGFRQGCPTISPGPRKKGGKGGEAGGRARGTAFTTFTAFRRPRGSRVSTHRPRAGPTPDRRRRTPRPKTRSQGTRAGRRMGVVIPTLRSPRCGPARPPLGPDPHPGPRPLHRRTRPFLLISTAAFWSSAECVQSATSRH